MAYLGRDYSSYQGALTDADCEGIQFAYVKITQGGSYINPDAAQQLAMLRKHGVLTGYYHFYDPTDDVGDQLHHFITTAQSFGETPLPFALDSEVAAANWPTLATDMMNFAIGVEAFPAPVPNPRSLLYVDVSFYKALAGFPWGRWVWLADPNPGAPHEACLVLQSAPRPVSSADLKVIDPDTFLGTEAQWATFTAQAQPAPPAPLPTNAVPGPNGIEVSVIGKMTNGTGLYYGRGAAGGITVYAGVGNPTTWVSGFDAKTLPEGTPLAVALTDLPHVAAASGYEQL